MKKIIPFLVLLSVQILYGQSEIRVRQYAQEYGKELAAKFGTKKAENIQTETKQAEAENNRYIIEMETTWDDYEGYLLRDKVKCLIRGVLTTNFDGGDKKFNETYRNEAFKKIEAGKIKKENWEPILQDVGKNILEKVFDEIINYNPAEPGQLQNSTIYKPLYDLGDFLLIKEMESVLGNDCAEGDPFTALPIRNFVITNSLLNPVYYYLGQCGENIKNQVSNFLTFNNAYETKAIQSKFKSLYFKLLSKNVNGQTIHKNYKLQPEKAYYIQYDENLFPALYYFIRKADYSFNLIEQPKLPLSTYSFYDLNDEPISEFAYKPDCLTYTKQGTTVIWNFCNYPVKIYASDCKNDVLYEKESALKIINPNDITVVFNKADNFFAKTIYIKDGFKYVKTPLLKSWKMYCIYPKTNSDGNTFNAVYELLKQ